MHKFWGLLAVATVASPALAAPAYRASGFLRTGYSEKLVAPGQWSVRGTGREPSKSVSVALYRAAELAAQAGASELRVTRQRIKSETMVERRTGYQRSYYETADLNVRAIRTEADRTACEMPQPSKCMTLPVAGLLATYGPRLDMAAALLGQAPAAPLHIVTTSPYQQAVADLLARHPEMRAPDAPKPVPRPLPVTMPMPMPVQVRPVTPAAQPSLVPLARAIAQGTKATATDSYAALLRAQQPVNSGPGWKMSD